MYAAPLAYLEAEFRRQDLLLHREIPRHRAAYQLSLDEFRGLYISDRQVDSLLPHLSGHGAEALTAQALTKQAQALRRVNMAALPPCHALIGQQGGREQRQWGRRQYPSK